MNMVLGVFKTRELFGMFFLSIIFVLPPLLAEVLFGGAKPSTIWYIRVIDVIDITVMTLVYIAIFMYFQYISIEKMGNKKLSIAYQLLFALFIGGHFMHFATNAIDTYMYEVAGYEAGVDIPRDVADLIYFLDEDLSHYLMFTALFTIWVIVTVARIFVMTKSSSSNTIGIIDRILIFLTSLIFGVAFAIATIEAKKAYLGIGLILISTAIIITFTCVIKQNILNIMKNDSVVAILLLSLIMALFIYIAYYAAFGSFIEPSEILREHSY